MSEEATKKLTLLKFSADWCGYCKGMERARTVEKFIEAHPDVGLKSYHTVDEGDEADLLMEKYDVEGLPAFVWEDGEGNAVLVEAGATSLTGLGKQYAKALKALETGNYGLDKKPKRSKR